MAAIVTDTQLFRWLLPVENFHDVCHYCVWITHPLHFA